MGRGNGPSWGPCDNPAPVIGAGSVWRTPLQKPRSRRLPLQPDRQRVPDEFEEALKAGKHPFTLIYFQNGGGATLELQWEGPDLPKQKVPAAALSHLPSP